MRRAAAALAVTAAAVVWLARYETHPPPRQSALRGGVPEVRPVGEPVRRSGVTGGPGVRSAEGPLLQTPFTVLQVRASVRGGRLVGVETVAMGSQDAHTNTLNDRAEPILREEALQAGSADVDVVTGATYTSRSWRQSLQAAIDEARRG